MHRLLNIHGPLLVAAHPKHTGRLPNWQRLSVHVRSVKTSAMLTCDLYLQTATAQELANARAILQDIKVISSKGPTPEQNEYCELHCDGRQGGAFRSTEYFSGLGTTTMGRLVLAADAVSSTQTIIQDNVAALPDGTLCIADKQQGGKGRGGNVWDSPPGCLMFSVCKRLELPGQQLPFVQYLVSLAAVQAIQQEAQLRLQGRSVDVRIKWPNDLYSGTLKLGGVLCHSSYREKLFYVIMGVGLNVSNRAPTTCIDALVEAEAAKAGLPQPEPVRREVLLAGMMTRLEVMLSTLCQQGFQPFQEDYYEAWLHSGQQVDLQEEGGPVRVTVAGLSKHGYLEAVDASGERYELHPDGNSFDFFNGLVRKKVAA